jgi:hypothetical protein
MQVTHNVDIDTFPTKFREGRKKLCNFFKLNNQARGWQIRCHFGNVLIAINPAHALPETVALAGSALRHWK